MDTLKSYDLFMIIAASEQIEEWAKIKIYQYNYLSCYQILRYIEVVVTDVILCHSEYDKLSQESKDKVCCLQMRLKELILMLDEANKKISFYDGDLTLAGPKEPLALIERFNRILPLYDSEEHFINKCKGRLCVDHDLVKKVIRSKIEISDPVPAEIGPAKSALISNSTFKNPQDSKKLMFGYKLVEPKQRKSIGSPIRLLSNQVLFLKNKKIDNFHIDNVDSDEPKKKIKKKEVLVVEKKVETLPEPESIHESNELLSSTLLSSKNATDKELCSIITAQSIMESEPLRRIRSSFRKILTFGRITDPIVKLNNDPYLRTIPITEINFDELSRRTKTFIDIHIPKGIITDFHELNKENKYIGILCYKKKNKRKVSISHCIIPDPADILSISWNHSKEVLKNTIIDLKTAQIGFLVKTEFMREKMKEVLEKLRYGQKTVPEYFVGVVGEYPTEFYFSRFQQKYFVTKFPVTMSENFLQMTENVKVTKKKSYCIYRLDPLNTSIH